MAKNSAIHMHKPPHPGEVLRDGVFTDSTISVTDFAQRLGVTRVTLSRMLNGKAGVSADMALRLAAALGGTAQSWLHMQANFDLWQAEKALKREVAKIEPLKILMTKKIAKSIDSKQEAANGQLSKWIDQLSKRIEYEDNPNAYLIQIEEMLSREHYTRERLIEYGVRMVGDYNYVRRSYNQLENRNKVLRDDIKEAFIMMRDKKASLEDVREWARTRPSGSHLWLVISDAISIPKKKISERAKDNASGARRAPLASEVQTFFDSFKKKEGTLHGAQQAAAVKFGVSEKTIQRLQPEKKV
jgi:antitoxin HigA-1